MQNSSVEDETNAQKEVIKKEKEATFLSWYTVIVTFICLFIFGYILSDGPPFKLFDKSSDNYQADQNQQENKTDQKQQKNQADQNQQENKTDQKQQKNQADQNQQENMSQPTRPKSFQNGFHRLGIFLLVLSSGAIGGCLYNFRGIKKHLENENFKSKYILSYFLRPLSAALSGLFIFTLALSGVFVITVGKADIHTHDVPSIMIFVSLSLLAGYGSHEFLKKVKDIMKTVFALSELEQRDEKNENNQ